MLRWNESPEWVQYKTCYQQTRDVKSASQLEAVSTRVSDLWPGFLKAFAGNEPLAQELFQVLDDQLGNKRRMLNQPRGRGPRPDRGEELKRHTAALEHELHALRGLRKLGGKEPWLEAVFVPVMRFTRSVVEARIGSVEREGTSSTHEALLSRARELSRTVAEELGPPPLES